MRVGSLEGRAASGACGIPQSWNTSPAGIRSGCDVDAALDALGAVCVTYERVSYSYAIMNLAARRDVARWSL